MNILSSTSLDLDSLRARLKSASGVFRQVPGTFRLVWRADWRSALSMAALTLVSAALPAAIAYVGKLIVDAVVTAARTGTAADRHQAFLYVVLELLLMVGSTTVNRGLAFLRELLRATLGNVVNVQILEKALSLELRHFEDAEVYDKMQNARREASSRPLSLVLQGFSIAQNTISLATYAVLLIRVAAWSVWVLIAASIPAFIAETQLSAASFRLNSWRAPEGRKLNYLEWILTRDSHVKEVKLYGLSSLILERYRRLFEKFFREDRNLAARRWVWGILLGLLSLGAFYACYAWVVNQAAQRVISLGEMTLYLTLFRQSQVGFQSIL